MTMVERVRLYITRLCADLGVSAEQIYNPSTNAWYFTEGNTTMEVFLTSQKNWTQETQHYIRCMAPLCEIPADITRQYRLFQTVLQINSKYLGFKISADEERGILCVIAERNISGLEYEEMVAMFGYLGHWAGKLDHFLKLEFA